MPVLMRADCQTTTGAGPPIQNTVGSEHLSSWLTLGISRATYSGLLRGDSHLHMPLSAAGAISIVC